MKAPKEITVQMLNQMGACSRGIADFQAVFGESAAFVPANIRLFRKKQHEGFLVLLRYLDDAAACRVVKKCTDSPDFGCICDKLAIPILNRLARQNLPKKAKARA